jgi:hypothetical protein
MHRNLIAAVLGLIAGLILHRGLGLRFVGVPMKNEAAAPAAPAGPRGAVEAQRQQALHDENLEELRKRLAAAEQDCAELRAKVAATPKAARPPTREEKIRILGSLLARMARQVKTKPPSVTPDIQKNLTEFMKLCTELGVDMTNSTTMFKNPEFSAGIFEGMLDEYGVTGDEAGRAEWKAGLAARLQALGDNPGALAVQKVSTDNLLDFYDRFGERLFEKDGQSARVLSSMSAGSAVSTSQITRKAVADYMLATITSGMALDDATKARLRPIAERWAAEYGTLIAEATQTHGETFMSSMMSHDNLPASNEAALRQIRETLRFKSRALDLEARALDEIAAQLPPEAVAELKKFDKAFYFKKISD